MSNSITRELHSVVAIVSSFSRPFVIIRRHKLNLVIWLQRDNDSMDNFDLRVVA